jgi:formamidopyrimidine-DNA glycosylase
VDDDGVAVGVSTSPRPAREALAVYVTRDPSSIGDRAAGPELLDDAFTVDAFAEILREAEATCIAAQPVDRGHRQRVQRRHPARRACRHLPASNLSGGGMTLHQCIHDVLTDAVTRSSGLAGDLKAEKKLGMRVHGREGQPCPVCGDVVRSVSFADSSLQYCATCQTDGKPLADRRLSKLLK